MKPKTLKIRLSLFAVSMILLSVFTYFTTTVYADNSGDVSPVPISVNAEPVTYDDVLVGLHTGQWYGWSDSDDRRYENLIVLDNQYKKPKKSKLIAAMKSLQTERDSFALDRAILKKNRSGIESRILDGTYSRADLIQYLRILGGF